MRNLRTQVWRTVRRTGTMLLLSALMVSLAVPAAAQTASQKKIDKLVNRSHYVIGALKSARLQVAATLKGYNAIIDGEVADTRAAYKQLGKDIKRSEQRAEDVRSEVQAMDQVANKFFADWEASLAEFSSDELRGKSEARLRETQANYGEILEAGKAAGAKFEPFVSQLKDQVLFLGNDLNPTGIAELQDEAAELNSRAEKVFEAVDEITKRASRYASALQP